MAIDKLLTNNPQAARRYGAIWDVEFKEAAAIDVLVQARDYIHRGHRLLTHPLASSIPHKDSPYKSVLVSGDSDVLDFESLRNIESAIGRYSQIGAISFDIPQSIALDFMMVDCEMLYRNTGNTNIMHKKEGML